MFLDKVHWKTRYIITIVVLAIAALNAFGWLSKIGINLNQQLFGIVTIGFLWGVAAVLCGYWMLTGIRWG